MSHLSASIWSSNLNVNVRRLSHSGTQMVKAVSRGTLQVSLAQPADPLTFAVSLPSPSLSSSEQAEHVVIL